MRKVPAQAPRRNTAVAALAGLCLLGLYLGFPDKVFVFDGVMFSGFIERATDEWRKELFNRRHLLFNPAFMLLRDTLRGLGLTVPGYALIQRANAVLAVAGVCAFYRLTLRLTQDHLLSWLASTVLGLSFCWWCRATEGQVYMVMTLGSVTAAWAAVALVQEPRPRHAAALAASLALTVLFHAAGLALLPMALAAFWSASRKLRPSAIAGLAALAGASVALPYAAAFGIRDFTSFSTFLQSATELAAPGRASLGHAMLERLWSVGGGGAEALRQTAQALVALPSGAAAAAGAALLGLWGWAYPSAGAGRR